MSFLRGFKMLSMYFLFWAFIAILAAPISSMDGLAVAAEQARHQCREKLSKKGMMIFDEVQHKRTSASNLDSIWKEVVRDLISANILGREEATAPAIEALNCLRSPQ